MAASQEAWLAISADSQSTRNKLVQWQAETSVQAAIREDRNRSCTTGIRTDQSLRFHPPGGSPAQPKDGHRKTSVLASAQPLRCDVTNVANSLCALSQMLHRFCAGAARQTKRAPRAGRPLPAMSKNHSAGCNWAVWRVPKCWRFNRNTSATIANCAISAGMVSAQ